MLRSRLGPILFFTLAGCSSASEPVAPLPTTSAALNSDDVVMIRAADHGIKVKGQGVLDLGGPTADATFEFVAEQKSNGRVKGHFRMTRPRGAFVVDFTGRVTCVTTDPAFPGRARIGGVVTRNSSTDPAFLTENHEVGDDVWFRVQDGSVGGGAVDASTTYGFKPTLVNTSAEYCALPFDGLPWWNPASIFPLKEGAIRLKD